MQKALVAPFISLRGCTTSEFNLARRSLWELAQQTLKAPVRDSEYHKHGYLCVHSHNKKEHLVCYYDYFSARSELNTCSVLQS